MVDNNNNDDQRKSVKKNILIERTTGRISDLSIVLIKIFNSFVTIFFFAIRLDSQIFQWIFSSQNDDEPKKKYHI